MMYKKMVVLLDGSKSAEVVFRYAQELAGRLSLDLELLHVALPNETEYLPMKRIYMDHMAQVLYGGAEEIRSHCEGAAAAHCIQAKGTVVVGDPADEILKYVDKSKIDLVMMATHGGSGVKKQWALGSVAHKVIYAAKVPIWLVPSELREEVVVDSLPKRRMVIPLSGTKQSEAVVPHALAIARQYGSDNQLVLVWVDSRTPVRYSDYPRERQHMEEYLNGVAASIREAGFDAYVEILEGSPAESIIDFIKSNPTQLVAMATRGRSGLNRMLLGSVAENVIHMIKVTPMLLVPGRR